MSGPSDVFLRAAMNDREKRPWRYYKLDYDNLCDGLDARVAEIDRLRFALETLKVMNDPHEDDTIAAVWAPCVSCGTEVGWPAAEDSKGWPPKPICQDCFIADALKVKT